MKKGLAKGAPEAPKGPAYVVDVRLFSGTRTIPDDLAAFDGYWKGSCVVLSSPQRPQLVGRQLTLEMRNAVAHAPYFTLRLPIPHGATAGGLETLRTTLVLIVDCKSEFNAEDVGFLGQEIGLANTTEQEELKKLALVAALARRSLTLADLQGCAALWPLIYAKSDLARAQYVQPLLMYFLPQGKKDGGAAGAEQRKRVCALSTDALKELVAHLKRAPWELVFKHPLKERYGRVKPLALEACWKACANFGLAVPPHIERALRIYTRVAAEPRHTWHEWNDYVSADVSAIKDGDQVRRYLEEHAIVFPWVNAPGNAPGNPAGQRFALHEHWDDAKRICLALLRYHTNARIHQPALRSPSEVPTMPPTLRGAGQLEAARSICDNCVTVLEGYPGTGKTVVITWAMSFFENVLLVTLTGAMASSLRDRNGGREEVAHTIDHVIYAALNCGDREGARIWLRRFDVLIIDEFSNVTTPKLAQLLWLLPNLVRVILVGDHHQIRSRKPGDPLGDLRDCFPLIELREILRVEPHLVNLAQVPKVLSEESVHQLVWRPEGPLSMVEPTGAANMAAADRLLLKNLLTEIWSIGGRCLMHHQIIVLQNSIRRTLNQMCHELAMEAGIISRRAAGVQIGGPTQVYCVGTKICFLHNYNKPVEWSEGSSNSVLEPGEARIKKPRKGQHQQDRVEARVWHGAPVVNGECGVIRAIEQLPQRKGWSLTFVVDDRPPQASAKTSAIQTGAKAPEPPEPKTVIISRTIPNAVSPNDMDFGYAITTTKVQGREYKFAVYWNNRGSSATNGYWSRAHPYVALTRGKERVWYVGYKRDLVGMCANVDPHRRTVLRELLATHYAPLFAAQHPAQSAGDPWPAPGEEDAPDYAVLPLGTPCVPVLATILAERAAKNEQAKKLKMVVAVVDGDDDNE